MRRQIGFGAFFLILSVFTSSSFAAALQDRLTLVLAKSEKLGEKSLVVHLVDGSGKPVHGASVEIRSSMLEMDMGTITSKASEKEDGSYQANVKFSMAGKWKIVAVASVAGEKVAEGTLESNISDMGDKPGDSMASMDMSQMPGMHGRLGDWGMQREGSGTSLLPDSSPMFMKYLGSSGRYEFTYMGGFSLNYTNSGGPRGESKFYSNSMPMLMVQNKTGGGVLDLDLMMSLDPIFDGEVGAPNLFQTGETAHGVPLVDHQHPHNLISELATSYSHPIAHDVNVFVYGGPIAEPALGGPMYMHRASGMEIPEAPITHHWFDSTHISSGVVTLGINNRQWQLEASAFNGHEPGENRYWPQPLGINSYSGRVTFNPNRNVSLSTSYGYLSSPEQDSPGVNQDRTTASGIFSLPLRGGDNLSATLYWGRIAQQATTSDAYTLEATYYHRDTSLFSRWENVDKDELANIPPGNYRINKILLGAVQNLKTISGFDFGVGAYGGVYAFPNSLDPYYGHSPVTLGIFLRIRPSRMNSDMKMKMGPKGS